METSPNKITHAVPLEVQRVLDAMTEENWRQDGWFDPADGKACFLHRACILRGVEMPSMRQGDKPVLRVPYEDLIDRDALFIDLNDRCRAEYQTSLIWLNDLANLSLSDFKSKIIALYQEQP